MSDGIPCTWMRGGTSKGGYFLASNLPTDPEARNTVLLRVMGSPDERQIDGMGGADPLTSKVAIVSASSKPGIDVDYLFLQVFVDEAKVSDAQGCGNLLAGVGGFAIEQGLVAASSGETTVKIFMENTGKVATATINTPKKIVDYSGDTAIDGVPGHSAGVALSFSDIAGANCGALLPSGNALDTVNGKDITLIDNGMPTVLLRATDFGISGYESREELDANDRLKSELEAIRLAVGETMNLGNVENQSVPKMTLLAPAKSGGVIMTRTFIPHRCHATIGVFCAVSVATACLIEGSVAYDMANKGTGTKRVLNVEHPLGQTGTVIDLNEDGSVMAAGMVRTARKLFEGKVFVG